MDGAERNEFIRIDGRSGDHEDHINTCVAFGFACGLNPVVPASIPKTCLKERDPWIFVNLASTAKKPEDCPLNYGLHVAIFKKSCPTEDCKDWGGGDNSFFGFFEVTRAKEVPAGRDAFEEFVMSVISLNGTFPFHPEQQNMYVTQDSRKIFFRP